MGKRIRVQHRGHGSSVYRAHTFHRVAPAAYPPLTTQDATPASIPGTVIELFNDPGRGTPLALLEFTDGTAFCSPAVEGSYVGQKVLRGAGAVPEIGNIVPLGKMPEGTMVCNIEARPGDGGTIAKASGAYSMVVSHTPSGTEVRLPSGRSLYLDDRGRATVGVVASAGRTEKPFLKAGTRSHLMRSRGRLWPVTRGQAMIAASHPHGGGSHQHAGKGTTVSRNAPPGRKVGLIAARQSGRAKRAVR